MVFTFESWPLTSIPLFADYVDTETSRYRIRFLAEFTASETTHEIRARDVKIRGLMYKRNFFGHFYGSINPFSPFGHHPNDNREALEQRLSKYFSGLTKRYQRVNRRRAEGLKSIRLDVIRLGKKNQDLQIHTVGRFDLARSIFIHTWKNK